MTTLKLIDCGLGMTDVYDGLGHLGSVIADEDGGFSPVRNPAFVGPNFATVAEAADFLANRPETDFERDFRTYKDVAKTAEIDSDAARAKAADNLHAKLSQWQAPLAGLSREYSDKYFDDGDESDIDVY